MIQDKLFNLIFGVLFKAHILKSYFSKYIMASLSKNYEPIKRDIN